MPSKLKSMRAQIKEELQHVPKQPEPQRELRMLYWSRRMHSLGRRATINQTSGEVLKECIDYLKGEYQDFEFAYDKDFFGNGPR